MGSVEEWLPGIPRIDVALAAALAIAALLAMTTRRRGGRFRALPGWLGFWLSFAAILICLSRLSTWVSSLLLGILMFVALRNYFFVAPMRPKDRHAILAAYFAIPFAVVTGFPATPDTFLATVPIVLFLLLPLLLSIGPPHDGLFDALGRLLFGVVLFIFCAAHLGLIGHLAPPGLLELFALLVLAADLPQRLAGRFRDGGGWATPAVGLVVSALGTVALAFVAGPWCGIAAEDAARAGLLVVLAVTTGGLVTEAIARELEQGSGALRAGRWAFLDRTIPAVYAAPVFFHYLNHFA